MKRILLPGVLLTCLISTVIGAVHPAELTIINNSERKLTVKVMKAGDAGSSKKFALVVIEKKGETKILFTETGNYYLKTLSEYPGREPLCTKGDPFNVYVGEDGYSVLNITITIKEDETAPDESARLPITKSEFDRDVE